jgi:hypothetical protein
VREPVGDGLDLLQETRNRLAGTEWTVTHSDLPDGFMLHFDHPLSCPLGLGVRPSPIAPRGTVERLLRRREFEVVKRAPKELPHKELLRALRTAATPPVDSPRRLTNEALAVVAGILSAFDVLTGDEADWLAHAGGAWRDDDAP